METRKLETGRVIRHIRYQKQECKKKHYRELREGRARQIKMSDKRKASRQWQR